MVFQIGNHWNLFIKAYSYIHHHVRLFSFLFNCWLLKYSLVLPLIIVVSALKDNFGYQRINSLCNFYLHMWTYLRWYVCNKNTAFQKRKTYVAFEITYSCLKFFYCTWASRTYIFIYQSSSLSLYIHICIYRIQDDVFFKV